MSRRDLHLLTKGRGSLGSFLHVLLIESNFCCLTATIYCMRISLIVKMLLSFEGGPFSKVSKKYSRRNLDWIWCCWSIFLPLVIFWIFSNRDQWLLEIRYNQLIERKIETLSEFGSISQKCLLPKLYWDGFLQKLY